VRPIRTLGEHEEDTLQRIGFIGLGNMGLPMCKNLVRAGYEVSTFDLLAEAVEEVFVGGQLLAVRLVEVATGTPLRTPAGNAVPEGELTYAT
jgi:6-phosphogluconate dehydrogenase (decarboxylating)